jgi:hypothetical protein
MKKMIFFLCLLFTIKLIAANKPATHVNQKLDFEISQLSYKYHLEGYPTKKIDDAYWAKKDLPHHYRYLHSMLVAAFFSERPDQLNEARMWLVDYQCENIMACQEAQSFLDVAMKAYSLIMKKNELKLLRQIQNQVDTQVKKFKSQKPSTAGLCAPNADRKKWFELGYEIYCPPFKTLTAQGDTNHLTTKSLLNLVEWQSQQVILSSSLVMDFGHDGDIDCETDWTVQLKCKVGSKDNAYKLNCARKKDSSKISCVEQKN